MNNSLKCQEMMSTQQESYQIIRIIKIIIDLLAMINQEKQILVFLNKKILREN